MVEQIRAGWYPDPSGAPQLRWYDEQGWSDQTTVDPMRTATAEPKNDFPDYPDLLFAEMPEQDQADDLIPPGGMSPYAGMDPRDIVLPVHPTTRREPARTESEPPPAPRAAPSEPSNPFAGHERFAAPPRPETRRGEGAPAAESPNPGFVPPSAAPTAPAPGPAPSSAPRAQQPPQAEPSRSGAPAPEAERREAPRAAAPRSGWSHIAETLQRAAEDPAKPLLEFQIGGLPALLVDMGDRAYWWPTDVDALPPSIPSLRVSARDPRESHPGSPGDDLDGLLWRLSRLLLDAANAPWVDQQGRYRLRRWPELERLPHSEVDVKLVEMLGHAALAPAELAALGSASKGDVTRLLSGLELLGLLRRENG